MEELITLGEAFFKDLNKKPKIKQHGKIIKVSFRPAEGEDMPVQFTDGTFRQRGNRYEYRFQHEGQQKSVYGSTKIECYQKRLDLIAGKITRKTNDRLFKDWIYEWYKIYKEPINKELTNAQMLYNIKTLVKVFGDIPLKKIDANIIQDYLNQYNDKKVMQKVLFDRINAPLKKAYELGYIPKNPCLSIELRKVKSKQKDALPFDQQDFLLENIKDDFYRNLFKFLCCTGLRISEALKLELKDIDFKNHLITIEKEESITKGGSRKVPFLKELFNCIPLPKNGKIFNKTYGSAYDEFKEIAKNLNMYYTFHNLRHTFISVCYYAKISAKQIQTWVGHSNIEMTLNRYTHLLESGSSFVLDYINKLKKELNIP